MTIGFSVDQLGNDPDLVAGTPDAAIEVGRNTQRRPDLQALLSLTYQASSGITFSSDLGSWAITSSVIPSAKKSLAGSTCWRQHGDRSRPISVRRSGHGFDKGAATGEAVAGYPSQRFGERLVYRSRHRRSEPPGRG
jgi:hypothetical protein